MVSLLPPIYNALNYIYAYIYLVKRFKTVYGYGVFYFRFYFRSGFRRLKVNAVNEKGSIYPLIFVNANLKLQRYYDCF